MSSAYCAVTFTYYFSNIKTLNVICFAYFHSVTKYGIIYWGNSMDGKNVWQLQEKVVRMMKGLNPNFMQTFIQSAGNIDSTFLLLLFYDILIVNLEYFTFNVSVRSINT